MPRCVRSRTSCAAVRCSPRLETLESRLFLAAPEMSDTNPFGIGSSAETSYLYANWMPQMSQIGIKWVRTGFDFGTVEPSRGTWSWSSSDSWVNTATSNGMYCSGLLIGAPSWLNVGSNKLPTGTKLTDWKTYVSAVVSRYKNSVGYWEVWNEPENFASSSTAADYGALVAATYDAAKAADPNCKIGMSVASVDIPYLEQAILSGAKDHFDYIVVHPYEMMGAITAGQEAEYMSIVPTIHKMLAADNPALANAPVWVTEFGTAVDAQNSTASQILQAQNLVKGYTMGIAQGIARMEWFEAQNSNYQLGLIWGSTPELAYWSYRNLISTLGPNPQYQGWVQLNGRDYGFVFQGSSGPVMVTWAPPGTADNVNFGGTVAVTDPIYGTVTNTATYSLTNAPVFVTGFSSTLITQARFNNTLAFPWGGDYTGAQSAQAVMSTTNTESGVHQVKPDSTSRAVTVNGVSARDCSQSGGQTFTIDPNFLSYTTAPITISIVVAKKPGVTYTPGFNIKYETPTGWAGKGWYGINSTNWTTITCTITDDRFVGKWGYSFSLNSDSTTYSQYYLRSVTVTKQTSATSAPTSVTLAVASDSGVIGDNQTNLNNGSTNRALSFNVAGTASGARVYVYAGSTLLGSTLATGSSTLVTTDGLSTLDDGSYAITAKQAASGQILSAATPVISLVIDTVLPTVAGVVVNDGNVQRSMVRSLTVSFSEAVTLSAGAIVLQQHGGGIVTSVTVTTSNPSGDNKAYVVTFLDSAGIPVSLPDGVYDLAVEAGQVQDKAGNGLAADYSFTFHRLFGDYDGNKIVNGADYFQFNKAFMTSSTSPGFVAWFDYEGNGTINGADYFQFNRRFGMLYSY